MSFAIPNKQSITLILSTNKLLCHPTCLLGQKYPSASYGVFYTYNLFAYEFSNTSLILSQRTILMLKDFAFIQYTMRNNVVNVVLSCICLI